MPQLTMAINHHKRAHLTGKLQELLSHQLQPSEYEALSEDMVDAQDQAPVEIWMSFIQCCDGRPERFRECEDGPPLAVADRPTTNKTKGYVWDVALPVGTAVTGVVLADQFRSLDWQARQL